MVPVDTTAVAGLWAVGSDFQDAPSASDDATDFSALDPQPPEDVPLCLLVGGNLLVGEIADPVLHVVSGSTVTEIPPSELSDVRRAPSDLDEVRPAFEFVLSGGDTLVGMLQEESLVIRSALGDFRIPSQHFVAARAALFQ